MALAPIHPEGPDIDSTLAPVQPEGFDAPTGGGGGGSPGGSNQQIQFNNGGAFGGTVGFTWNSATQALQMATPFIDFRLQGDGGIFLVGGSATGSGYVVGGNDQLVWGNNALRLTVEPTGEFLINNDAGLAGQVFTTGGIGGSPSWQTVSGSVPTPVATSGYQDVTFTTPKAGGDSTGLSNDATVFSAQVQVDGGPIQPVDVTGSNAQTFTDLLTEINVDLTGAVASLVDGQLRIQSASTGGTSVIFIIDLGLFSSLTDFLGIRGTVPGESTTGWTLRYSGAAWEATNEIRIVNDINTIQIGPQGNYNFNTGGTEILVYSGSGGSGGDNNGGIIQLAAGAGFGNGVGGGIQLTAGAGSGNAGTGFAGNVSAGGTITVEGGVGWNDQSGSMNFTVPTPIVNNGAPVVGGYINFNPGAGVNDAAGGYFVVFAGTGGNSAAGLGVGGGVSLIGGDGGGGGDNPGGGMLISAGAGQANGIGGTVQIFGGLNGGSIEIAAGVAGPPQVGGSITLSPGVGTGTDDGNVYIGAAASTSDTRNGNFVYLPTSTGTPTGTPVANPGLASAVIDTTNERIYVLVGGVWKFAQLV